MKFKKSSIVLAAITLLLFLLTTAPVAFAETGDIPGADYYTGSASGYGGSIRVTVGVKDGELVEVTAVGKGESEGIGTVAVENLPGLMMEAQSWDVDIVSGATITSEGVIKAAKLAMTEAGLVVESEATPAPEATAAPEVPAAPEATEPAATPASEPSGEPAQESDLTLIIIIAVVLLAVVGGAVVLTGKNKSK